MTSLNIEKTKNNMEKIVLWFTWEMWCWKDTASNYIFNKYWWKTFKFSSSLRDILARIHIEPTRENLSAISRILREEFWQDQLAKIMKEDVKAAEDHIILIDWVRRKDDIVHLTQIPEFKLIYIDTSLDKRYNRIITRWENSDDIGKTMEQFQKEQLLETEIQIRWLKEIADVVIDNNWSFEELYAQIDKLIW